MNSNQKRERHPFTPEEDKKLRELVNRFGEKNWSLISGLMMNRTVRQCRDRWTNSLCGNVIKGEWTSEEDSLLLQLFKEYGSRWKSMEKFFPGRAQYDIRNHCKSILRQKMYAINFLNQKRSTNSPKKNFMCSLQIPKEESSCIENSPLNPSTPIPIPIVTNSSIVKSYLDTFDCFDNTENSNELPSYSQKQNEQNYTNEKSFNETYMHEKLLINNNSDISKSFKEKELIPSNNIKDNLLDSNNNTNLNNSSNKKSFINLQKIDPILVPFISEPMLLGISSS